MAVQIEARDPLPDAAPLGMSGGSPSLAMSSTGTSIRSSSRFFSEVSTMVTGRHRAASPAPANSSWSACAGSAARVFVALRAGRSGARFVSDPCLARV
jgi:hypothetical protein